MANFTPQMLRDLLASPDPKDQELARQLSAMEFSNENGRLANYPDPTQTAYSTQNEDAKLGNYPAPGTDASQFMQTPQETAPVQPWVQTVQPPQNVGGPTPDQMAAMDKANAPAPDPFQQELVPNQFRNEQTGNITTLPPPPAAPQANKDMPGAQSEYPGYQQPTPQSDAANGIKVLQSVQRADGKLWQLVSAPAIDGYGRQSMQTQFREVTPSAIDPAKMAQMNMDTKQAGIEHVKAETSKLNETPAQAAERTFQVEKAKLKAQNSAFEGMGATTGASGQDLLANVPAGIATQVKKLASGEMAFPGGFAMRSPYWQNMLTLTAQYDPTFDATNFNKRNQTAAAFSKGMQGNSVRAINQTISHMGNLVDNINALDNFNGIGTPLNYVVNPIESAFGNPNQGNFKQTVQAVASEMRRVFSTGGVGNLMELKQWEDTIPLNASKEQQTSYLQNGVTLLKGALQALDGQYKAGMGLNASVTDLLTPKAKSTLAKLDGNSAPAGNPTSPQQNSVTLPNGRVKVFPSGAAAQAFRQAAGI